MAASPLSAAATWARPSRRPGRGGNTVELFGRTTRTSRWGRGRRPRRALPGGRRRARRRGPTLAGKVVVDITNPLNFETFDSLTVPADGSATAEIAAALPHSTVLKAFNTTFGGTLAAGTVGPLPTTVLIAGDDADAKSLLAGWSRPAACAPSTPVAVARPRARVARPPADHPRRGREGLLDRWARRRRLTPRAARAGARLPGWPATPHAP